MDLFLMFRGLLAGTEFFILFLRRSVEYGF